MPYQHAHRFEQSMGGPITTQRSRRPRVVKFLTWFPFGRATCLCKLGMCVAMQTKINNPPHPHPYARNHRNCNTHRKHRRTRGHVNKRIPSACRRCNELCANCIAALLAPSYSNRHRVLQRSPIGTLITRHVPNTMQHERCHPQATARSTQHRAHMANNATHPMRLYRVLSIVALMMLQLHIRLAVTIVKRHAVFLLR